MDGVCGEVQGGGESAGEDTTFAYSVEPEPEQCEGGAVNVTLAMSDHIDINWNLDPDSLILFAETLIECAKVAKYGSGS